MAAFTPTGVKAGDPAISNSISTSATVTAGNAITGKGKLVDPQSTDVTELEIAGVALQDAASGGSVVVLKKGSKVTVTNTLTFPRQIIVARSNQWQYDDDILSGDEYIIIGYSIDANTVVIDPKRTGETA